MTPLVENAEGQYVVPPKAAAVAEVISAVAADAATVQDGLPAVKTVAADVAQASSDVASGKGISDFAASLIRTATPSLVGAGLTLLATNAGVHVPAAYEPLIDTGATFALGTAYYLVVRALETKFKGLGWLLGVPRKPVYGS